MIDTSLAEPIVSFYHSSIYLAGRYAKLQRNIAQSPWIDPSLPSVSGYIDAIVAKHFQAAGCKFCSAGREDIDVRMLGDGRPFLLEICNPKRYLLLEPPVSKQDNPLSLSSSYCPQSAFQKLLDDICKEVPVASSGSVSIGQKVWLVHGVASAQLIKVAELDRPKIYKAIISSKAPLMASIKVENISIDQKTPIRVLHRRANIHRKKMIYECIISSISEDNLFMEMTIRTQAGT